MNQTYSWDWVDHQACETMRLWESCTSHRIEAGERYTESEQALREAAYDEGLATVEREIRQVPKTKRQRVLTQQRVLAAFGAFASAALDLDETTTDLLTGEFLPVGTGLAQWARQFDETLSMADIIQACRNAWTACGLQPLFGRPVKLTPSILGYSLLYPYSDNLLDQENCTTEAKQEFSARFRRLLEGKDVLATNERETSIRRLIRLIETEYSRVEYPQVFECLLAIHRAQEQSIEQVSRRGVWSVEELLRVSCRKGGSSVLADGCLAAGRMTDAESRFSFAWGVLLQLGDDLQDVQEDLKRGSVTLFSREVAAGRTLDALTLRLLRFSEAVGAMMDELPKGTPRLKTLLKMAWRSLIIRAAADSQEFFSPAMVHEAEAHSPFRFDFLRSRQKKLTAWNGLYANLFDVFLEGAGETSQLSFSAPREWPVRPERTEPSIA